MPDALAESKKIVCLGVELVNVGSKLINKKGIAAVFALSDEASAISTLNTTTLKAEWVSVPLSSNIVELAELAKAKLDIQNAKAEAKILDGINLVVRAAYLLEDNLLFVSQVKGYFA